MPTCIAQAGYLGGGQDCLACSLMVPMWRIHLSRDSLRADVLGLHCNYLSQLGMLAPKIRSDHITYQISSSEFLSTLILG